MFVLSQLKSTLLTLVGRHIKVAGVMGAEHWACLGNLLPRLFSDSKCTAGRESEESEVSGDASLI